MSAIERNNVSVSGCGTIPMIFAHGYGCDQNMWRLVAPAFADDYKLRRTRQRLYIALGETLDGRLAFVVFRRMSGGLIRVVTARDMDDNERRLFRRK